MLIDFRILLPDGFDRQSEQIDDPSILAMLSKVATVSIRSNNCLQARPSIKPQMLSFSACDPESAAVQLDAIVRN